MFTLSGTSSDIERGVTGLPLGWLVVLANQDQVMVAGGTHADLGGGGREAQGDVG